MIAGKKLQVAFAVAMLAAATASAADQPAGNLSDEAKRGRYLVQITGCNAANLRLTVKDMSADQFLILARSPLRPPMPWFNLRDMKDSDVKAIYAYLKHLGPAGEAAPAYVPPDKSPVGPIVRFPEPPKKPGA